MATYDVEVCRISYATKNLIVVDVNSEEEAKEVALDNAGNFIFSEHCSEYETGEVFELTNEYMLSLSRIGERNVIVKPSSKIQNKSNYTKENSISEGAVC